jgi:predicted component of type VI protein secretion system
MQLVVKQAGSLIKEYHFEKGPVYIGRQINSQIPLSDVSVSRQHAVVFGPDEDKWFIEDLESANKTFLNDKAIHKSELNDGDVVRIGNFSIDIFLKEASDAPKKQAGMADTFVGAIHAPDTIIRRFEASDAPDFKMPAQRARDFSRAASDIFNASKPENLLQILLNLTVEQFDPFHIWIGLRTETSGPMPFTVGKKSTGQSVKLTDMMYQKMISDSLEKKEYTLIPHIPKFKQYERIRSALIAPIVYQDECYGVIYVDNDIKKRHYSLTDLDYLTLLSVQAGVVIKNF